MDKNSRSENQVVLHLEIGDSLRKQPSLIDLDQSIQDVLFWENTINRLDAENHDLAAQNKLLQGQIVLLKSSNATDVQSISRLQTTVKSLQEMLQKHINEEVEIKSLREQVIMQEDRAEKAEVKLKHEKVKFENLYKLQQRKNTQEVLKLKQDINKENTLKEEKHTSDMKNLRDDLENERNIRQEMEKKHESEMVKLQIEYEGKIALVQAQNSRLQSNCGNSSFVSNDVFRKKLQHIQEESSREINKLKQEISVLRLKTGEEFESKETPERHPSRGKPGILKRRRV